MTKLKWSKHKKCSKNVVFITVTPLDIFEQTVQILVIPTDQ